MTRLAVIAVAAIYAFSLAGLATVLRAPEPLHSQADVRVATTQIETESRSACRVVAKPDAAAGRVVVVDVGRTA